MAATHNATAVAASGAGGGRDRVMKQRSWAEDDRAIGGLGAPCSCGGSFVAECAVNGGRDVAGGFGAASPAAVRTWRAWVFGDGPGGDHAGDAARRAVEGDPAAALGGCLYGAQVRGEQGVR